MPLKDRTCHQYSPRNRTDGAIPASGLKHPLLYRSNIQSRDKSRLQNLWAWYTFSQRRDTCRKASFVFLAAEGNRRQHDRQKSISLEGYPARRPSCSPTSEASWPYIGDDTEHTGLRARIRNTDRG